MGTGAYCPSFQEQGPADMTTKSRSASTRLISADHDESSEHHQQLLEPHSFQWTNEVKWQECAVEVEGAYFHTQQTDHRQGNLHWFSNLMDLQSGQDLGQLQSSAPPVDIRHHSAVVGPTNTFLPHIMGKLGNQNHKLEETVTPPTAATYLSSPHSSTFAGWMCSIQCLHR